MMIENNNNVIIIKQKKVEILKIGKFSGEEFSMEKFRRRRIWTQKSSQTMMIVIMIRILLLLLWKHYHHITWIMKWFLSLSNIKHQTNNNNKFCFSQFNSDIMEKSSHYNSILQIQQQTKQASKRRRIRDLLLFSGGGERWNFCTHI